MLFYIKSDKIIPQETTSVWGVKYHDLEKIAKNARELVGNEFT